MFFLYNCFSFLLFPANESSGTGQQDVVTQVVAENILKNLQRQTTQKGQPGQQIWAFTRCLSARIASSRICPQHCGVILTDAHGNILDSRGFYKAHGSVQEFDMPSNSQGILLLR